MTAVAQPALTTRGLTKSFPAVRAVDGISFDVYPGEIFGLVGPDGAGKTTTLRMLAGVMLPDEGTATVAGCDVVHDPEGAKRHLSYMPQRFALYEDLTVEENIRFYADLFGVKADERRARSVQLLDAAGMSEFRKRLACAAPRKCWPSPSHCVLRHQASYCFIRSQPQSLAVWDWV